MSTTEASRDYAGTEIPAAGTYVFDPTHSSIEFSVRHLMVSKVRGRFAPPTGSFTIAQDPARSTVDVEVAASSISTNDEARDGHLRSADFLDVERFPAIRFTSTSVEHVVGTGWKLTGNLTVKDVSRPVTFALVVEGAARDPWGNTKVGFNASAEIDREDWGLTWNQPLETGGVLVGKKVTIEIVVEAALQA